MSSHNRPRLFGDDDDDTEASSAPLYKKKPGPGGRGGARVDREEELKRQEQDLDEIHSAVHEISKISMNIHGALEQQNDALSDMSHHMDSTQTSLEQVTARTNMLVQKAGGPRPFMIIGFLVCVALVLLMLVIYT